MFPRSGWGWRISQGHCVERLLEDSLAIAVAGSALTREGKEGMLSRIYCSALDIVCLFLSLT